mgnify:CR=1 FL=1
MTLKVGLESGSDLLADLNRLWLLERLVLEPQEKTGDSPEMGVLALAIDAA